MEAILFYGFAAVLVVFSILTITARNPVRSAMYLISALLSIAGLFFLLGAELVGAVQVLVYVGGVMVLFLFVILLFSLRGLEGQRRASRQWKAGVALGVVLVIEMGLLVMHGGADWFSTPASRTMATAGTGNTEAVGTMLYTSYLLPFEIVSVLLLVAIVGAIVLAKREL